MNREQAINTFCFEYIRVNKLAIPLVNVRDIIENKLVETRDRFYCHGLQSVIAKEPLLQEDK